MSFTFALFQFFRWARRALLAPPAPPAPLCQSDVVRAPWGPEGRTSPRENRWIDSRRKTPPRPGTWVACERRVKTISAHLNRYAKCPRLKDHGMSCGSLARSHCRTLRGPCQDRCAPPSPPPLPCPGSRLLSADKGPNSHKSWTFFGGSLSWLECDCSFMADWKNCCCCCLSGISGHPSRHASRESCGGSDHTARAARAAEVLQRVRLVRSALGDECGRKISTKKLTAGFDTFLCCGCY